ncbi:LOG family protein, partial [bacterium]|nr:LOG family protein [bacterium]
IIHISLPYEQEPNPFQTPSLSFEFHYFFIRKFWFFYLAKAMVVFPGGYGTLDEFFELLTLVQTEKTKKYMPIILYGQDYWKRVLNFEAMVEYGTISPEDLNLFTIMDDVDSAFEHIKRELTEHHLG